MLLIAVVVALTIAVMHLLPRAIGTADERPIGRHEAAQASQHPPIPCLSYAPFRRDGHTPFDPRLILSDAELLEDLRLLKAHTACVRLYGTAQGQSRIPVLAEQLGLQVVVGAWISRDREASRQEIEAALAMARQHPQVVRMIVVGNEVLLRQERSPQEVAALLREVRKRSPVPVAYADVWEFWLRHAAILAPEVDVVAIHVLPYWEDVPLGLPDAVNHVVDIVRLVERQLPHQTVWLAETGWPAAGRQRGPAVPGPREQTLFVRDLRSRLAQENIDYNLIEGFDQPWKRWLEGAMGGAWGLLQADGQTRDRRAPSLPPDPTAVGALAGWLVGSSLGLVLMLASQRGLRKGRRAFAAQALGCGVTSGFGLLVGAHLGSLTAWPRNAAEWGLQVLVLSASMMVGLGSIGAAWRQLLRDEGSLTSRVTTIERLVWPMLVSTFLFLSACLALPLVFDGRYRPLPAWLMAGPVIGLWMARWAGAPLGFKLRDRLLAGVLCGAAPAVVFMEGIDNHQAVGLAVCWALIGGAVWSGRESIAPAQAAVLNRPH